MSISDTANARKYASIAEVAAAQAKLSADKLDNAPDYAAQAAASAAAAASSAQVAVSAESVVNGLAISASESATQAAASAAEAGDAASAAIGQCIRVPEGELISVLPAAADRIDSFMTFGSSGNTELLSKSDVAILDNTGKIPVSMIPAIAITETYVVSSQAAMLALNAQVGDVAKRTDLGYSFILSATPPSTLANWVQLNDDVLAQLGQSSGAGQVGALTQAGASSTVQSVLDSHVEKTSLAASSGGSLVGMPQGGTLAQNLVTVHVDAFGADPTGATESTNAVLNAIRSIYGTVPDSTYNAATYKPAVIVFGIGTYVVKDIPFISGCLYKGQSNFSTRIDPATGAAWAFTTVGTTDYPSGGISKRFVGGGLRDMSIGAGNLTALHAPSVDASAVRIQYASWVQLENVLIKNVHGNGLWVDELWDADISLCQIQAAGLGYTGTNNYVGLHIGPGTNATDGSNAIRFTGFHIEGCPKLYEILERTRHVSFPDAKFEGTPLAVSNVIQGVTEVSFDNAELTWQRSDFPMVYAINGDSDGVSFNGARLISASNTPGWYFRYNSVNGPLMLNNLRARNVAKIIDGSNFIMDGAASWFSGPNIVNAFQRGKVSNCIFRASRAPTTSDGTTDTLLMTGTWCDFSDNTIEVGGSNSNGAACINITSGATDAVAARNVLLGATQYGVRQNGAVTSKNIKDYRVGTTGNIPTLITGATALYTITSPNSAGLGRGGVNGTTADIPIAVNASASGLPAAGCTLMLLRFSYGGSTVSAIVLVESATSGIVILGQTTTSGGNTLQTGTGAAGDGSIRISKSGATVTFTNYTTAAATLTATSLSALA